MEDTKRMEPVTMENGYKNGYQQNNHDEPRFGICFDVDGVLARGTHALPAAKTAMAKLADDNGNIRVPVAYVTNALSLNQDKANQIAGWFGIKVHADQVIHSATPLRMFESLHKKHCLLIGQGPLEKIANDLGFHKVCFVEDVRQAYPLLDMVDHGNRKTAVRNGFVKTNLPPIEAVVLLGEPTHWESCLQLLVDILKTDGHPDQAPPVAPYPHIPVVACNMDLQFMERAPMPRFGHGAFLLCLEALYKVCTGHELAYTSLVGKPSEVTFRYAEHILNHQARQLGILEPLQRMYMIGDSVESDITGANLYQRYIDGAKVQGNNEEVVSHCDKELPRSRNVPTDTALLPQSVESCVGILVCTGCYSPRIKDIDATDNIVYKGHRDFPKDTVLHKPQCTLADVNEAVEYIMTQECHDPPFSS